MFIISMADTPRVMVVPSLDKMPLPKKEMGHPETIRKA